MMQAISEETEKQSESVEQIRVGIDQISTVVQVNAVTAEASAASSHELSKYAEHQLELISVFRLFGEASGEAEKAPAEVPVETSGQAPAEAPEKSAKESSKKPAENKTKAVCSGKYESQSIKVV